MHYFREYFLSQHGSDRNPGTKASPWRTLARIASAELCPGDRIWLAGGETFHGSLILDRFSGTSEFPIRIASTGNNRARILAGAGGAILIRDRGGYHLSGLQLVGEGASANRADGICLFSSAGKGGDERLDAITIEDVDVSGFGRSGISVGATGSVGFRELRFRRITAHHNGYAGIYVWSDQRDYAHCDLLIQECDCHHNSGHLGRTQHSGHGILVTKVDNAIVERCRAYENGSQNTAHICGPAGIWASDSRRIIIRHNEAFRNHTASATDGGGFGLDGGMVESVLENNLSYDNDGPGYLLAQYFGTQPFRDNRIVGNRSRDDARRNDHGAIHLWATWGDALRDSVIEGNDVELTPAALGRPRALFIEGETRNLVLRENTFRAQGIALLIEAQAAQPGLRWERNRVDAESGGVLWRGKHFFEMADWLKALPGTERALSTLCHLLPDPQCTTCAPLHRTQPIGLPYEQTACLPSD